MYVVIDSNIYCGDYFARSAPFRYLIHFLNNAGHTLLIPRVVLQEVPNVRARKVAEESEGLRKALASLRRMTESSFPYPHSEITFDDYDLQAVMSERVENVEVIEYLHVDHATIFQRALNVRRPFRPGEKGYRDSLLWLSLLQFLKSKPVGTKVVFINGNKNDFYADEHEIKFHPDLLKDLEATPNLGPTTAERSVAAICGDLPQRPLRPNCGLMAPATGRRLVKATPLGIMAIASLREIKVAQASGHSYEPFNVAQSVTPV